MKDNVVNRRDKRIRQLTVGDLAEDQSKDLSIHLSDPEPDPEFLWKKGQGRWKDDMFGGFEEDPGNKKDKQTSFWKMMLVRLVVSCFIFAGLWAIEQYKPSWSLPLRAFVAEALTEEMDFGAVETWYTRNFGGTPSFIPIFNYQGDHGLKVNSSSSFNVPLDGTIGGPFALSLRGVEVIPSNDSNRRTQVKSVSTGRILAVQNDALNGQTVMIQHAGGYVSIYGHLEQPSVEAGDWVEGGEVIGSLPLPAGDSLPTLYFALKKDDRYLDPADVIPFD